MKTTRNDRQAAPGIPGDELVKVRDLGRLPYAAAYQLQCDLHARVLSLRDTADDTTTIGELLLLEHDPPVITVSRRPDARSHLIATPEVLANHGVTVATTDRGGDITYHGPGQLVAYAILDLNRLGLKLHAYMRLLEEAVIRTCGAFDIAATRDDDATGVWVADDQGRPTSKICAIGIRVRRWVTMHGLALNVSTNLEHFDLIVPCGLHGRRVTSMQRERGARGEAAPDLSEVKRALARELGALIAEQAGRRAGRSADLRVDEQSDV